MGAVGCCVGLHLFLGQEGLLFTIRNKRKQNDIKENLSIQSFSEIFFVESLELFF